MKLEFLYPELCNLYGEMSNMNYLKSSMPDAELVITRLGEEPAFLSGKVDLVYMGAMTERGQRLALEQMRQHKEDYRRLIEGGTVFLATGNAMELFGRAIYENGKKVLDGLGIFDFTCERKMMERHNSKFLGTFGDLKIVGYKSQFSHTREPVEPALFQIIGGYGTDLKSKQEGIRVKNFFGTYLLGPLLLLNPKFTRYLMKLAGCDAAPAFEEAALEAYEYRLRELEQPGVNFFVTEHD